MVNAELAPKSITCPFLNHVTMFTGLPVDVQTRLVVFVGSLKDRSLMTIEGPEWREN